MGGAKKIVAKPPGMGDAQQKHDDTMGRLHNRRLQKALESAKGNAVLSRKIRKMIKDNTTSPGMHSKADLLSVGAGR
ncbi:hypothetical protein D3C71_1554140 [compost metagenome]